MKSIGCCTVCHKSESKYCCPRCNTGTCSLVCSREHKKRKDCDGKRDPVKFVSLKEFDDLTLLSDYRLLESAGRVVEACARDPMKRYTRYKEELPKHLRYLKNAIYQRGCRLKYLPQHFVRHSKNSTYLNWQTRILKWKVEWNFDQAGLQKITEGLSESALLGKAVCSLLEDPELVYYKSAGIRRMKILILAEEQKGKRKRYYECDPSLTLRGNLQGLTIIEYPIMHVVLENHIQAYKILPRGEDDVDLGVQGIIDSDPSASEASEDSDKSSSEDSEDSSSSDESEDERQLSPKKNGNFPQLQKDEESQHETKQETSPRLQGEDLQRREDIGSIPATPMTDQFIMECDIKKEPEDFPTFTMPLPLVVKTESLEDEMNHDSVKSWDVIEHPGWSLLVPKVEKDDDMTEASSSNNEGQPRPEQSSGVDGGACEAAMDVNDSVSEVPPPPARVLVCYDISDSDTE